MADSACFIDSNVWLYAFIEGDAPDKTRRAQSVIRGELPVVSTQVINEVSVNLLRHGIFDEAGLGDVIASFYARYRVISPTAAILADASRLRQRYALSFWDGLIVSSALASGVPVLYSEDMQSGLVVDERLTLRNPFAEASS
jgi:predicted nucleic acid-binding protein